MKQTAVEWLVKEILVEVDRYDDEGNKIGIDYWNAYKSCTSLLEYVNKAKQMEKQQIKEAYLRGIENYDSTFKKK